MKKLGIVFLVILVLVSGTACASNKPVEPTESPKVVETKSIPKEKEIKKAEEAIKAEPKKEEVKPEQVPELDPEPEPEPVPTVVVEASSSRQIWFEFYDYLGKSHSALIQDPGFLQRINAVLDEVPAANTQAIPYMGGGTKLRVVENGGSRDLVFLAGEGPHSVVGRGGSGTLFQIPRCIRNLWRPTTMICTV